MAAYRAVAVGWSPMPGMDRTGSVAVEARNGEPAQIGHDVVGDLPREAPAVRETAGMGIAVGREEWNTRHESPGARLR